MKKIITVVATLSLIAVMAGSLMMPIAYADCGGTKTQLVSCSDGAGVGAISDLIKIAVTILSVLIGAVAVGGLAYAAIIYTSARDNQEQVNNAKGIVRNVIIGLMLYVFTIAIVNWLIPGGIISGGVAGTGTDSSTDSSTSPSPSSAPLQ